MTVPRTGRRRRPRRKRPPRRPSLRFRPAAWAKLLFLRDLGPTEVGGFGVTAPGDPLLVEDLVLVRQRCSAAFVAFDDAAVADFFEDQVDAGRRPEEFARVWVHTHPGCSAAPSAVDRATFARAFGRCGRAVMAILARGGETYAELHERQSVPTLLDVAVDFAGPFPGADPAAWRAEYGRNVRPLASGLRPAFDVAGPGSPDGSDTSLLHGDGLGPVAFPLAWEFP